MYKYYSRLGFLLIKHNGEGNKIYKEIFNNIPHFTKNRLRVNCLQDIFLCTRINYSLTNKSSFLLLLIMWYLCIPAKTKICNWFYYWWHDIQIWSVYKEKMDEIYLTETTITEWPQLVNDLWDERDKPYSGYFYF